jgi:hypothetical protein
MEEEAKGKKKGAKWGHGVLVWRHLLFRSLLVAFWSWFVVDAESNVRHQQSLAEVTIRPSVARCFAVAKGYVLES